MAHCAWRSETKDNILCILEPRDYFKITETVTLAKATQGEVCSSVNVYFNLFSKKGHPQELGRDVVLISK